MPAPAYAIDAIQTPLPDKLDTWHVSTAPPLSVTYAFLPTTNPWTVAQMDAVRWGLHEYESVINVRYVEVAADAPDPDITFSRAAMSGHGGQATWTYTYSTDANGEVTSKSWDADVQFATDYDITNYGFRNTIVHEIGHAMLMKHPGDYDSTGNHPPPPFLPAGEDNVDYSVMSYNAGPGGAPAYQLELYDIAALQARWGANSNSEAGDSIYTFNQDLGGVFAIWDTGGNDSIDGTFASNRVNINLNEGTFSKLVTQNRLSIAWGVKIENAAGSGFNDTLTGNAYDNVLTGNGGDDLLDGGAGVDTAAYSGVRGNYSWSQGADGSWSIVDSRTTNSDGTDTLRSIEFLRFSDVTVDITSNSPNPPPDPNQGRVYNSPGPGSTITGGNGDDTINASQGPDVLTGGAGNDVFAWAKAPWSPAKVMDFEQGHDRLDLSALFQTSGYTGSDPVADGYIRFVAVQGGTGIIFDSDGKAQGDPWGTYIINLQGVPNYQANWGVIANGDSPPTFNFSGPILHRAEGSGGLTDFTFTVSRTGGTGAASVSWSVAGAGANPAAQDDFSSADPSRFPFGTLSFAAGEMSKTFAVQVVGDTRVEPDEDFTVTLFTASGGVVGTNNKTTATIVNDDSATQPPPGGGQVYNSPGPGSTVTAGDGDDTINASQGSDVLTGGAGNDVFAWAKEPWSPARITDFAVGHDRLDFSKLFATAGYTGSDPVADKYVWLIDDGAGGTKVLFDHDGSGANPQWPNYVLQLEHVSSQGLTWAQLAGNGAPPPPPPPEGKVLTSPGPGSTLTGGAGDDTLNASRGSDTLTGGAGSDRFVFAHENWAPATITDLETGHDKVDLRGVFDDWGYTGTDPIGDGHVILLADSAGTKVLLDHDGPGGDWGNYVLLIQGVQPGQLAAGDFIFQ